MDYDRIGKALQVEKNRVYVDQSFLDKQNIDAPLSLTRSDGIRLFNKIAVKNGFVPSPDPLIYMSLDDNVDDYLRKSYNRHYYAAVDIYGMRQELADRGKNPSRDIGKYLPDGVPYSECAFVKATPDIKQAVDDFVDTHVQLTHAYDRGESTDSKQVAKLRFDLDTKGQNLVSQLDVNDPNIYIADSVNLDLSGLDTGQLNQ